MNGGNQHIELRNACGGLKPAAGLRGFTLVEVVLVMTLLAIMAALVWPALDTKMQSYHLPESSNNVRAMLRLVRATASMTGHRYRIRWTAKEQQPIVEYEVDAMNQPNVWKACEEDWATQPMLLGETQVTEIVAGRPDYLTPVSHTAGASADEDFAPTDFGFDEGILSGAKDQNGTAGRSASLENGEKPDPHRATITFDIDGHSDWYTIKLARNIAPGQVVPDDVPQQWILLDGRTGLPLMQDAMTAEQLTDASKRPDLDKLQPPDPPKDEMDEASTDPADALAGAAAAMGGMQGGMPGGMPGGEQGDQNGMNGSQDAQAQMEKAAQAAEEAAKSAEEGQQKDGGMNKPQDANTNATGGSNRAGGSRRGGTRGGK